MSLPKHDIVVIGSSAGGVQALRELVGSFQNNLTASIFIVQHLAPDHLSFLPEILSKNGPLPAVHPKDGELIRQGTIYVALPDHHLIIDHDRILVKRGPKENNFRPSIDALMRSAAYWYGPSVIGVVLTGYLNDGTSGLWSVRQFGGTTIVQDPADAAHPDMPRNVMEYIDVNYSLPLAKIGELINTLTQKPVHTSPQTDKLLQTRMKAEIEVAAQQNALSKGINHMGEKTDLTCPECGGALVGIEEGATIRYRCHTGHGFSSAALWAGIAETVETKLWQTLRSMEEGILFLEQAATRCEMQGNRAATNELSLKAELLKTKSNMLLDFIYTHGRIYDIKS
jgi:two-component system chemotaxis response regulator CheB